MTDEQIIQKAKEYLVKNDLDCDEIGDGEETKDWLKDGYFMVVGEQNECCYFVPMKKATEDRELYVERCLVDVQKFIKAGYYCLETQETIKVHAIEDIREFVKEIEMEEQVEDTPEARDRDANKEGLELNYSGEEK